MTAIDIAVRRGPGHWWRSYGAMLRWTLVQQRILFAAIVFSQILMGVGSVLMYRMYLGDVDPVTAAYLVAGIPTLSIIPVGFLMVPIVVMQEKFRGTFEFTWSLPVPRMVPVAATFSVFVALGLPVAALATWVAAGSFGVDLTAAWTVVPAAVLVSLMATAVGYGMAVAIPEPRLTNLITNVVVFLVLLFSPIVIPIERFPDWAAAAHRVLPFFHMANLLRSELTTGLTSGVAVSVAVLVAWTIVGWMLVGWIVTRRG